MRPLVSRCFQNLVKFIKAALLTNTDNLPWHDARYGEASNNELWKQIILVLVITGLVAFDVTKVLNGDPNMDLQDESARVSLQNIYSQERKTRVGFFFAPCAVGLLQFIALPLLARVGVIRTRLGRKKALLALYFVQVFALVVTEIGTGEAGFSDSCMWVIGKSVTPHIPHDTHLHTHPPTHGTPPPTHGTHDTHTRTYHYRS